VSNSIAAVLSVAVGATAGPSIRGGTHNIDAYDAYITARAALTDPALVPNDMLLFGINQLERATEFDPQFALAWAWQAIAYHRASFLKTHGRPELKAKANRAAARAYEIAPDDAWVLTAAALRSMSEFDWADAEKKFALARAAATGSENPWACSGCFALTVGKTDEALTYLRQASEADPLFAANPMAVAQAYEFRREFDLADAELAACEKLSGTEPMLSFRKHSLAFSRHDPALIRATGERLPPQSYFRHLATLIDRPQELFAELDQRVKARPPDATSGFAIPPAIYFAYLGKPQMALEIIRIAAFDATNTRMIWSPVFSDMRKLPEFKQLVTDLKLVDYWRNTGKWGDFCKPIGSDDFECH
jgi:Tfp pilus assembly protein PilF